MAPQTLPAEVENPDVRPGRVWEWSGLWSVALVALEELAVLLEAISEPPALVVILLAALPVAARYVRQRIRGKASSFRRLHRDP